MKKHIVLLISAVFFFSGGSVTANEKVDKALQVQSDGVVEISNIRGIVKVKGWDKDQVAVTGTLDDLAEGITFENKDKVTLIKVEMPDHNINHGDGSDLTIQVPYGNQVDFEGISSDLKVKNIKAGIDVRTVSGDIGVEGVEKILNIKTVSGDIQLKKSTGKAKLATVSGDIDGVINCPEVQVSSVSGDVNLKLDEYQNFYASVVSGNITIEGKQLDGGETKLSSVNGDINLLFINKINTRVNVKTGPGGDITNHLSKDKVITEFPNTQRLSITLGDGSGSVKLGTVNGDIKIRGKN